MKLDRTDRTIIAELQRNGRLNNRELADKAHLSESACLGRVRALEEAGVIDRYAALVSQSKVGLPGNVFVSITLGRQEQADLAAFEEAVKRVPEVMECYLMTGPQDYLLRVVVTDPADFERLFEGSILTVKYFFDVLNPDYTGDLLFRGVEAKGDILKHPEALQQAFEAGRRLVLE